MDKSKNQNDTYFNFPCEFAIKCIGKHTNFKNIVCDILSKYSDNITSNQVKTRTSSKGNYLAVTITIVATDRLQLDAIYADLNNHPAVLYSL